MNRIPQKVTRFAGLDVHVETISVAIAETGVEVRYLGSISNRPESVSKLIKKIGTGGKWKSLLRSRTDGVCIVLAIDKSEDRV
jgi:hypothetical protein